MFCKEKRQIKLLMAFLYEEIQISTIRRKAVEKATKTIVEYKTTGNLNQYWALLCVATSYNSGQ